MLWLAECRICELPFGQSRLNSPARPRHPCFATDRCVESRGGFRGNSPNIGNTMPSRFPLQTLHSSKLLRSFSSKRDRLFAIESPPPVAALEQRHLGVISEL